MKRTILNILLIILTVLISFFGMGPVLFADGSSQERTLTLLVVIALYLILILAFYFVNRRIRK